MAEKTLFQSYVCNFFARDFANRSVLWSSIPICLSAARRVILMFHNVQWHFKGKISSRQTISNNQSISVLELSCSCTFSKSTCWPSKRKLSTTIIYLTLPLWHLIRRRVLFAFFRLIIDPQKLAPRSKTSSFKNE